MEKNTVKSDIYKPYTTWSLLLGISLVLLGALTVFLAAATAVFTIIFVGVILMVRGILLLAYSVISPRQTRFLQGMVQGLFSLAVGALIVARPAIAAVALGWLIAGFLIVAGIFQIVSGFARYRRGNWEIFAGIVAMVLGIWVAAAGPAFTLWLLGVLIGLEILLLGIGMLRLRRAFSLSLLQVPEIVTPGERKAERDERNEDSGASRRKTGT